MDSQIKCYDTCYFAEDGDIRQGHLLTGEFISSINHPSIELLHKSPKKPIIGVSLNDVIPSQIGQFIYDNGLIPIGHKIHILTDGTIRWQFPPELQLPYRQPIYADFETSYPTWRYSHVKIGQIDKPQDEAGWCTIKVGF